MSVDWKIRNLWNFSDDKPDAFFAPLWSKRTERSYSDFFKHGGWKKPKNWINPGGVMANPAQQLADPGNFFTSKEHENWLGGDVSDRTTASAVIAGLIYGGGSLLSSLGSGASVGTSGSSAGASSGPSIGPGSAGGNPGLASASGGQNTLGGIGRSSFGDIDWMNMLSNSGSYNTNNNTSSNYVENPNFTNPNRQASLAKMQREKEIQDLKKSALGDLTEPIMKRNNFLSTL